MANVFSDDPTNDDDQTPSARVASTLTGDDEDGASQETPTAQQPTAVGATDESAQSYLVPAGADDDAPQIDSSGDGQQPPVSADTSVYAKPIAPPTLSPYKTLPDHSADQDAMVAQKKAESQQNIKPSVGRRILAGLAGGAVAFGGGNGESVEQNVLNRPAQQAQQHWAMQEAPIQARINADQAADAAVDKGNEITTRENTLAEQNYQNQNRGQQSAARAQDYAAQAEARANAITSFTPDDPSNPYAGGTATTAGGKTIKGAPPPDSFINRWIKTPQGQQATQQMTLKQRAAAADQIGLKGDKRQYFLANGKLSEPTEHTSVNIRENPDGSAVTPASSNVNNDPGALIAKSMNAKQAYADSIHHNSDGTMTDANGNPVTLKEFNDRIDKFRTDLNAEPVMRKTGTMVDETGKTITNRFSRNPQVQQPAQPQQQQQPQQPPAPVYKAKSGSTVTVGTPVVVNGKRGTVSGFDSKGKPIVKY